MYIPLIITSWPVILRVQGSRNLWEVVYQCYSLGRKHSTSRAYPHDFHPHLRVGYASSIRRKIPMVNHFVACGFYVYRCAEYMLAVLLLAQHADGIQRVGGAAEMQLDVLRQRHF